MHITKKSSGYCVLVEMNITSLKHSRWGVSQRSTRSIFYSLSWITTLSKIFHRTFNKYMKATGSNLSTELGKSSSRPSTLFTTPEFNFKPHELVNHILLFSWTGRKRLFTSQVTANPKEIGDWLFLCREWGQRDIPGWKEKLQTSIMEFKQYLSNKQDWRFTAFPWSMIPPLGTGSCSFSSSLQRSA